MKTDAVELSYDRSSKYQSVGVMSPLFGCFLILRSNNCYKRTKYSTRQSENLDGKPITFLRGKNSLGPKTKIKLSVDTSNPTICPDITGFLSRQLQEIGNKSSWINIILPNKGKSLMGKVSLNLY